MKTKFFISLGIIGCGIVVAGFVVVTASAQTETAAPTGITNAADIQYPIVELGNCKNREDCKTYCDAPSHLEACIAYAEKNNLMSKGDIDTAKKFLEAGAKGPGGCTTKDSCQSYCDNISRINECVAFAKKTGILPPEQLQEAEQVRAAIAKGIEPPPCKNKKECDAYCDEPSNMKVCVAFGEAAGFLKDKNLEDAKKIATAIDNGATPPPCRGKDACDTYCSQPEHMEACMTFAQAAGLMSPQEMQDTQKMLDAIKKGVKPPACKGKDGCDKYCVQKEHFEECTNFAVAAGFMNEKDAEMARKTGGKGPGDCASKEACDAFCKDPQNQQICINFAKDNGLISSEELQKMQEGQKRFQESFQNMPAVVLDCLRTSLGIDLLEKLKGGQIMPSQAEGEKMRQCFSQMGGPPGQGQGMMPGGPGAGGSMPPQGQGMHGGPDGGQNFGPQSPQGQMVPGSSTPHAGMPPISSMPGEVQSCIKSAIGADAFSEFQSGSMKVEDQAVLFASVRDCFTKFGPPPSGATMPPQGTMPAYQYTSGTGPNMPPGSYPAPSGSYPPPPGSYPPPPGTSVQQLEPQMQQPYTQPLDQSTPLPPPPEPATTPSFQSQGFFGALIGLFGPVLGL